MAQFDYIAELKTPSLKLHENGSMPSPSEIEAYFVKVEHMRQEYLAFISEKNDKVQKVYFAELQEAVGEIEKRGFVQLRSNNLSTAAVAGVSEAHTLMLLRNIDSRLKASAEKTITFVKSLLGDDAVVPSQPAEPEKVEEKQEDSTDVIRGVKGLGTFLGVGTTKAQAIINSKVLLKTNPPIQYSSGGWRFRKKRLQEYWDKHPTFVDDIKCPH